MSLGFFLMASSDLATLLKLYSLDCFINVLIA